MCCDWSENFSCNSILGIGCTLKNAPPQLNCQTAQHTETRNDWLTQHKRDFPLQFHLHDLTVIHCLSKSDRFCGVKRACFGKRTRQSIAEHKVQQRSDQGGGENSKTSQAEFECIIYEIKKAYLRWFCKSNSKKTRGEQFREVQSSQGTAKQRQQKDTSVRESLSGGIKYNPSDRATDWPAEDPRIVKNISSILTQTQV